MATTTVFRPFHWVSHAPKGEKELQKKDFGPSSRPAEIGDPDSYLFMLYLEVNFVQTAFPLH